MTKHVTCGCCSDGCTCTLHMDIPNGKLPKMCDGCKSLPFAPLDRDYRYVARLGIYVRKPQGRND